MKAMRREAPEHSHLDLTLRLQPCFSYRNQVQQLSYVHYLNTSIQHLLSNFTPLRIDPASYSLFRESSYQPSFSSSLQSFKSFLYPQSENPQPTNPLVFPFNKSQQKLPSSLHSSPTPQEQCPSSIFAGQEDQKVKRESLNLKYENSEIKVEEDSGPALELLRQISSGCQEIDSKDNCSSKKYGTFSKEEKQTILDFLKLNGVTATLEKFGPTDPRVTRRKLRNWLMNVGKPKNVKGKKTNDPDRNEALFEWMKEFKEKFNRPPTRRELRLKALEVSNDRGFIASKGWLDKFTKKFKVDLTPIKSIR